MMLPSELPLNQQPNGYVALYRGERPPTCMNADRVVDVLTGAPSAGRWFISSLSYAQSHLSPRRGGDYLRGMLDLPVAPRVLKYPERYGEDAVWTLRGILLPRQVAREYFIRNVYIDAGDGRRTHRRVEHPERQRRAFRRFLKGRGEDGRAAWLLPASLVNESTILAQGSYRDVWAFCDSYILRGMKPLPPTVVNITLDELERFVPQVIETFEFMGEPTPDEWRAYAALKFPNIPLRMVELLDGEDLEDYLGLAREVSTALHRRR